MLFLNVVSKLHIVMCKNFRSVNDNVFSYVFYNFVRIILCEAIGLLLKEIKIKKKVYGGTLIYWRHKIKFFKR